MKTIYNCAIDGGNSSINIVIDGENFKRSFPSIQSDPLPAKANYNNAIMSRNTSDQLWNKLHVETELHINNPKVTYRSEFLFGNMAEEYQKDLRSRGNREKYQDKDLAKWMIASLSYALLEKKMKEESYVIKKDDTLQININLSTGLPYREAIDQRKQQEWANMFQGVHRTNFKHPIFNNLTIELVIEKVLVFIEGEMGLNLEIYKTGGIVDTTPADALLNKKMVMIDIGGHTTELVTLAFELFQDDSYDEYDISDDEIEVIPVTKAHLTDGIERGIKTIMEDVITEVQEQYRLEVGKPLKVLTSRDIELAFSQKGKLSGKIGYILPEQIYVKGIFDRQAQNLAMDVVQKLHTLFQGHSISELDTIFMCGGGSRFSSITDTIRKELSILGYNSEKIFSVDDPIFANARGYYFAMSQYIEDAEDIV